MIQVEIIAIGNELLSGYTVNENAAFISRELVNAGFALQRHTSVGDIPELMEETLRRALRENDIVITTGGLGPTLDDITRASIAKVMNCGMRYDKTVAEELLKRYGKSLKTIEDQATIPEKATALLNPVGSAPGLLFEENGKILVVLPGVPFEMKSLFVNQVLPFLKIKFNQLKRPVVESVNFIGIPEPEVDAVLRELQTAHPNVQFGIYPNQGIVIARLTADTHDTLAEPIARLKKQFKENIFESASGYISEAVHELFKKKGWTLSCAESCSGGAISAALTQYAGASDYFKGSLVTYSNEMKMQFLNVSENTLQTKGAVSEETVLEMVNGLMQSVQTDWGVAVTGIAGPSGGTPDKPVGTVWCAVMKKGEKPHTWKFHFKGDRAANIERTVNLALGKLYHLSLT